MIYYQDAVFSEHKKTYRDSKRINKLGFITYRYRAAGFLQDKKIIDQYFEAQHLNARSQKSGGSSSSSSSGTSSSNSNATKRKFKHDPGAVDGGWKKKKNRSS